MGLNEMTERTELQSRLSKLIEAHTWLREFDPPAHREPAIEHAMHVINVRIIGFQTRIQILEIEENEKERKRGIAEAQRAF